MFDEYIYKRSTNVKLENMKLKLRMVGVYLKKYIL